MHDIWITDLGLQVLADKARRVADDVERTRSVLGSASGRDLGAVGDVHRAVVDRWTVGPGVGSAAAAADQLAGEISACAAEYQARDEGTGQDPPPEVDLSERACVGGEAAGAPTIGTAVDLTGLGA